MVVRYKLYMKMVVSQLYVVYFSKDFSSAMVLVICDTLYTLSLTVQLYSPACGRRCRAPPGRARAAAPGPRSR